mgnify:FL=1
MTENEVIELLRSMQNPKQDYADIVCAPAFCTGFRFVYPEPEDYAIEEAIKALKEIQQYREIGTVEQVRNQKHNLEMAYKIISDYEAIGTVEECREAVEKQKPKKCIIDSCSDHAHYKCPSCGRIELSIYKHGFPRLGRITKYCENCGQAIDENLEGMEDE